MKTAIIILNWKGADVTIDCLRSLADADGDFFVVVADNGSCDGSVEKIEAWLGESDFRYKKVVEGGEQSVTCECGQVLLYALGRNYGFAKGNNMAAKLAMQSLPDNILLLNNDTVVCKDFLVKLCDFRSAYPEYKVLTPLINFYSDKQRIWNAGGRLRYGFRKYYYAGCTPESIVEKDYIDISFVTGCALFVPASLLDAEQRLLTERFFFGEEDFEFSIRMAKGAVKMACVLNSLIYHKVGTSLNKKHNVPGKVYIHYLNRFIDVRQCYSPLFVVLWRAFYLPYIALLLRKKGCSFGEIFSFLKRLYRESRVKEEVTYDDFIKALSLDWCGKELKK